jgi:hypothetical protein
VHNRPGIWILSFGGVFIFSDFGQIYIPGGYLAWYLAFSLVTVGSQKYRNE